MATSVRAALLKIAPGQPVSRVRTMGQVVAESAGSRRFPMLLLAVFAGVALLLAAVGVYGVVNYVVSQRMREMGIRMALGATGSQVTRLVIRRSLLPIGAGIVAGILGSVGASRLLAALLYRVQPDDPTRARHDRRAARNVRANGVIDAGAPGSGGRSTGRPARGIAATSPDSLGRERRDLQQ